MMGEHEEQDLEPESENHAGERAGPAGFAAGLVVGALLGASFALLFAPDRGDRTRRGVWTRLGLRGDVGGVGRGRAGRITRKDVLRRRRRLREQIEKALDRL